MYTVPPLLLLRSHLQLAAPPLLDYVCFYVTVNKHVIRLLIDDTIDFHKLRNLATGHRELNSCRVGMLLSDKIPSVSG